MNIFQRSSLDSTAKVPIKAENDNLTTVEASEPIPYDESAALIEDDNKHVSTSVSLAKEVERRDGVCQEFYSTRKDSLTLLSATLESILLVEKTPIIKSLQKKDRTIEDYVKIEQDLRDKVKKLESFIDLCNTIQTNLDSDCKRLKSYVGVLKEEKTTLIEKNAELNHKLIAAELRLEAVSGEKKQLELQVEEEVKQAVDALTELRGQIKANNEEMEKLTIDKTALEEDNVNLILQVKALNNENDALVQVKSSMQEKYTLELLTIKREKEVLEVDNAALKRNIVELKSRLSTKFDNAVIITFLGFVLGLLLQNFWIQRP